MQICNTKGPRYFYSVVYGISAPSHSRHSASLSPHKKFLLLLHNTLKDNSTFMVIALPFLVCSFCKVVVKSYAISQKIINTNGKFRKKRNCSVRIKWVIVIHFLITSYSASYIPLEQIAANTCCGIGGFSKITEKYLDFFRYYFWKAHNIWANIRKPILSMRGGR